MGKIEKRLCALAVVFVIVYLGAAALTLHGRMAVQKEARLNYESTGIGRAESRLALAQLFAPMMVLLAIAVSFVIVKKRRSRQLAEMDTAAEAADADHRPPPPPQE
jgi:hypothetical protein